MNPKPMVLSLAVQCMQVPENLTDLVRRLPPASYEVKAYEGNE